MENLSVHDNTIIKYMVDFENRQIIFHTKNEDQEWIDILFTNVVAYLFEDTIMGGIVLDIEKWNVEDLISCLGEKYILDHKNYGWPFDFKDINDFKNQINQDKITILCLASSYGMSGFILTKSAQFITKRI